MAKRAHFLPESGGATSTWPISSKLERKGFTHDRLSPPTRPKPINERQGVRFSGRCQNSSHTDRTALLLTIFRRFRLHVACQDLLLLDCDWNCFAICGLNRGHVPFPYLSSSVACTTFTAEKVPLRSEIQERLFVLFVFAFPRL